MTKLASAGIGEVVALGPHGRCRHRPAALDIGQGEAGGDWPAPAAPLFSLALAVENRNDEVKLTAALAKLSEEDPSLSVVHEPDTHELVLWGQGEIHLQIAADRLRLKYNLPVKTSRPQVKYKETIRGSTVQHARFKRQSGGHGQFGDVHVDDQAAAARQRLRLHRRDRRRRHAAPVHPLGRGGHPRLSRPRPAGIPGGRCGGGLDRRPVPYGRQLRQAFKTAGAHGHERGHAEMRSGAAGADLSGDHRRAQRIHRRGFMA